MHNKVKEYLKKLELFTAEEIEIFSTKCELDVVLPSNSGGIVEVHFNQKKLLNSDHIELIKTNFQKYSNLECKFNFKNEMCDSEELRKHLLHFLKINELSDFALVLCIENPLVKYEDNILFIPYANEKEKEKISNIHIEILKYLNSIGINAKVINYLFDTARRDRALRFDHEKNMLNEKKLIDSSQKTTIDNMNKSNSFHKNNLNFAELKGNTKNISLTGEIYKWESREFFKGQVKITIGITDLTTGALTLVYNSNFNKRSNLSAAFLSTFKIGDWVNVLINTGKPDESTGEFSGEIIKIKKIDKPSMFLISDKEDKKRIELLTHTKMSAFDGIITSSSVINQLDDAGYEYVGFCDRGNVQSFPDVFNSLKGKKIKPIYGCEFEIINKEPSIVINGNDDLIKKKTFVLFDLETTGLYPFIDDIIEFGAIKYANGKIIEKKQMFVKPHKKISDKISRLTNITNDMVKNAKNICNALKEIVDFIGDAVLIAHNGINFDFNFLNVHLEKNGFPILKNTLIDTLQISRAFSFTKYHNLKRVCKYFEIFYDDTVAHRADQDCEYLLAIWLKFLELFSEKNIFTMNDINLKLISEDLYKYSSGFVANIYAKNTEGLKSLYKLVSNASTKNFYNRPTLFFTDVQELRENLIICPHPTEGDIFNSLMSAPLISFEAAFEKYDYIFIAPPKNLCHKVDLDEMTNNDVELILTKIIDTSIKYQKKVIAVGDCYYLHKWQKCAHDVYISSKMIGGKSHRLYQSSETVQKTPDFHFLNTTQMKKAFNFLNDDTLIEEIVVENSIVFAKKISFDFSPVKNGFFPPKIEGTNEKLRSLVEQNAKNIYGATLPELVRARIDKELNAIIGNNFGIVYWVSHLLVKKSLEDGYLVGSRGSVGSSFVAYLCEISEVNPLEAHYLCPKCKKFEIFAEQADGYDLENKICPNCNTGMNSDGHNIPFETFMGFKGEKVPDIDLNFSGIYQPKAHKFIKEMFDDDHAFRAGTISTIATKTAYGYVKSYLESRQIKSSNAWIDFLVKQCEGVKKTTGQHPGGIVVIPLDLDVAEFTPYNYPSDDKTKGGLTTHFPYESMHDSLLKFDILGHDDPTSLKMLHELTGIDPRKIPCKDERVIKLFNSINSLDVIDKKYITSNIGSLGIPEFGTTFVRKMLSKTLPQSFNDLIRISGLSHGADVWMNNAETLIKQYALTLSDVIGCRDDIMVYLMSVGIDSSHSFEIMEAVRKGKSLTQEQKTLLKKHGVKNWYIDSCDKIKYLFPKAHATAYVLMAWRVAWYKIYKPLEFYAVYFSVRVVAHDVFTLRRGKDAVLNKYNELVSINNAKGYGKPKLNAKEINLLDFYEAVLEMYSRGYEIANVDLNLSDAKNFVVHEGKIIPPFIAIDGLGETAANSIIEAREKKQFDSIADFSARTGVNKTSMNKLKDLGVLDHLREDDQMSLF